MDSQCEQLVAFADGELEPTEADNFRAHLRDCESCQAGLVEAMQLSAMLSILKDRPMKTKPWCVVEYGILNSRMDRVISKHKWRWVAKLMARLQQRRVKRLRKTHPRFGVEVRWLPAPK